MSKNYTKPNVEGYVDKPSDILNMSISYLSKGFLFLVEESFERIKEQVIDANDDNICKRR
jgi:hypothetical protein